MFIRSALIRSIQNASVFQIVPFVAGFSLLLSAACEAGRSDIAARNNCYLFTQVSLKCCTERYEPPSAEECDLLLPLSAT